MSFKRKRRRAQPFLFLIFFLDSRDEDLQRPRASNSTFSLSDKILGRQGERPPPSLDQLEVAPNHHDLTLSFSFFP